MESDSSVSGYDTVTNQWVRANRNKKKPRRKPSVQDDMNRSEGQNEGDDSHAGEMRNKNEQGKLTNVAELSKDVRKDDQLDIEVVRKPVSETPICKGGPIRPACVLRDACERLERRSTVR